MRVPRLVRPLAVFAALALAGPAAAPTYTLRWGDTLGAVAHRLGVSVSALAGANHIRNPNRVRAGQVLVVPGRPGPAPAPAPAQRQALSRSYYVAGGSGGVGSYRVRRGDTIAAIAGRFHTSTNLLVWVNGLQHPNRLQVGQVLAVPAPATWTCPVAGPHSFHDDFGAARAGGQRHAGNDVFAKAGTPVVAPVSGVVEHRVGPVGGNAFYLNGDDLVRYYGAHLARFMTGVGRVARGTVVGLVGNTGDAAHTASHLHFEIHPGGGPAVDPYPTLKRWC